jgi:acyl-CoA oxidase
VLSAGCKAAFSDYAQKAVQLMREACAGHGYSAYNKLGRWRDDHDIFLTFEGYACETE